MLLVHTNAELQKLVAEARARGQSIGLVPTMGALHQGHGSLIHQAAAECDFVVTSIFVNPTQFGPNEDLAAYPRTLEADCALAEAAGCAVIYAPSVEEVYPQVPLTRVHVEALTSGLCGASRPTHFDGVCTVVTILFNLVRPDKAYFGLKDYQQFQVVKRMAADLHQGIEVVPCPLVREPDGLAMSSRNKYLSPEERLQALVLHKALLTAEQLVKSGEKSSEVILEAARGVILGAASAKIDYVALVDPETLDPVEAIKGPARMVEAVFLGATRLIDNLLLVPEG